MAKSSKKSKEPTAQEGISTPPDMESNNGFVTAGSAKPADAKKAPAKSTGRAKSVGRNRGATPRKASAGRKTGAKTHSNRRRPEMSGLLTRQSGSVHTSSPSGVCRMASPGIRHTTGWKRGASCRKNPTGAADLHSPKTKDLVPKPRRAFPGSNLLSSPGAD